MVDNDISNVYLHVGFGRTSSTTLQTQIFPQIANFKKNLKFLSVKSKIIQKNIKLAKDRRLIYKSFFDNLKTEEKLILSDESLLGEHQKLDSIRNKDIIPSEDFPWPINSFPWCPSTYVESFKKNSEIFNKNTNIIITIRKPSLWLRSVFTKCSNVAPSEFFVSRKDENIPNTFLITEFNLNKLINLYKKNFNNVFVIKFEDIENFNFAREIFKLNEDEIQSLKTIYKKKRIKNGYNFHGFHFKLFLTRIGNSKLSTIFPFMKRLSNGGKLQEKLVFAYEKMRSKKNLELNYSSLGVDIKKMDQEYELIESI